MEVIASIKSIGMKKKITRRISWIDGHWESINTAMIPIQDRGLNYADGIFETILILQGKIKFFSAHLNRWKTSAKKLGMATPPEETWLNPIIKEGIARCSMQESHGALRLNWSRGDNQSRGITITTHEPNSSSHRFWAELNTTTPQFEPISTIISSNEKRNADSQLSFCKTFAYGQGIQARREAQLNGFDDALLLSTTGEICCGTSANLLVKRNNELLTPRLKSGCLPGVMRQQGLKSGLFKEAKINRIPQKNDEWLLINSLSCRPIYKLNKKILNTFKNAESLWLSLYNINL